MDSDSYTHRDLALELGVSVPTIKSWRRKFPDSLPLLNQGKPLRLAPQALEVCRIIRDGYQAGLSSHELRQRLEDSQPQVAQSAGQGPTTVSEGLLADLAQNIAELVRTQQQTAQRLERLEQSLGKQLGQHLGQHLGQMHGHPRLLEELLALKRQNALAMPEPASPRPERANTAPQAAGSTPRAEDQPRKREGVRATDQTNRGHEEGLPAQPEQSQEQQQTPQAPKRPQRVVRIRTRTGEYERYALQPLGPEPQPGARPEPDEAFLKLPVVAQNAQGDYLGVPGLTVGTLAARLQPGCGWTRKGGLWLLTLATLPARTLTLTPTVTPRGNEVAALTRLATPTTELDAEARIAFLRGLRRG